MMIIGWRWNVDPVDQISVSNYAVNGNNPIWRYDVLGNFDSKREAKDYKKENMLKGRVVSSKEEGVNYEIRNRNYTYFKDSTSPSMDENGVTKAYRITAKKWKSSSNSYTAWMRDPALIESGAYKRAHEGGYMPFMLDGFGVSGSLGAGGFTAEGEGSIGFYADRNGNIGGVTSAEGGWGFKSPGPTASISLDFYNYKEYLDVDIVKRGYIKTNLQLGVIGFSYTQSTDKNLRSNNNLNIFSISFGLRGFGFTQKVGASGYIGTKKMIKMNRYGFIYSFFIVLIFSGCDEYQDCMKFVEYNIYPISGSVVIDTLYTRYGYRGMYNAVSKDKKDTLKVEYYNAFPRTPQKGDSIVKILNEPNYTLYSKDSFFVMGLDCRIKRVVTFESGLIEDVQINQIEEVEE